MMWTPNLVTICHQSYHIIVDYILLHFFIHSFTPLPSGNCQFVLCPMSLFCFVHSFWFFKSPHINEIMQYFPFSFPLPWWQLLSLFSETWDIVSQWLIMCFGLFWSYPWFVWSFVFCFFPFASFLMIRERPGPGNDNHGEVGWGVQLLVHFCVLLSRAQEWGTKQGPGLSRRAGLACTQKEI